MPLTKCRTHTRDSPLTGFAFMQAVKAFLPISKPYTKSKNSSWISYYPSPAMLQTLVYSAFEEILQGKGWKPILQNHNKRVSTPITNPFIHILCAVNGSSAPQMSSWLPYLFFWEVKQPWPPLNWVICDWMIFVKFEPLLAQFWEQKTDSIFRESTNSNKCHPYERERESSTKSCG